MGIPTDQLSPGNFFQKNRFFYDCLSFNYLPFDYLRSVGGIPTALISLAKLRLSILAATGCYALYKRGMVLASSVNGFENGNEDSDNSFQDMAQDTTLFSSPYTLSPTENGSADHQKWCVLLVDDDRDSLEITAFLLEQVGMDVIRTNSAAAALAALSRRVPDLLISDIGMPDVDGYMLIQQIRRRPSEKGGNVPAIALTAYASPQDNERAIKAGFQRYITKPVDPDILIQAVRNLLT